jgi:hypothetical protein
MFKLEDVIASIQSITDKLNEAPRPTLLALTTPRTSGTGVLTTRQWPTCVQWQEPNYE